MDSSQLVLTTDMLWVLGLAGLTVLMFMTERIRPDGAALAVLVALGLLGLVPAERIFDGFAGSAVICLMATMILGAGLDRTGVLNRLAIQLLRRSRGKESRLVLLASGCAGLLSAFMQNPAVASLMLPVASRLSSRTGVALSRMLLPIAACIVMGGCLTMVGNSPLILLNDLLLSANGNLPSGAAMLEPLPMFAPLPIGLMLLGACLGYWHFFGRRWLREDDASRVAPARTDSYFAQTYGIEGDVWELTITADSPLVGMSVGDAEAQPGTPLLLALKAGNDLRMAPPADARLWVGSVLGVLGPKQQVQDYAQKNLLRASLRLKHFADLFNPATAGISEAVIPPTSSFIGRTLGQLRLRKRAGVSILAINRDRTIWRENNRRIPLRAGDVLVFHSIWTDLAHAAESRDFIVVTDYPKAEQRPHKLRWAVGVFVVTMALALSNLLPVSLALMTGAAAMVASGVLNMDDAYQSISWRTVFLMACLIPLGWAMDSTAAASWVAQQTVMRLGGDIPIWAVQAMLAILTTVFGLAIGNVGATVIMVPIAINLALVCGGQPTAFALIAALSASNNFLSASNPVMAMVLSPAGYQPNDLLRAGLPLSLLYLAIVVAGVNLLPLASGG